MLLQIEVEGEKKPQTKSCWQKMCCSLGKKSSENETEQFYLKNTINPAEPIRSEVQLCRAQVEDIEVDEHHSKYDLLNYPHAIPEEVFVYFSAEHSNPNQMTKKEMLLNMHFLNKHFQVLEQREEKEVFLANGFTQRNQRGDEQEERLRTDIISDFNEFESINREFDSILGDPQNAIIQSTEFKNLKQQTESVLRQKLTP